MDSVPTDQDDNGNDAFVSGAIRSNPITLAYASEPLSESDLGLGDATVTPDGYHNLTVDFGFYQTVNLGNLVWADVDNEGDKDASEVGIDGVEVRLFKAGDDPLTATAVLTAVTSGGGFYNFDNLTPGQYFVYIPTPPAAYPVSSTPTDTADNGQDDDDNGSQNASGQPVRSPDLDLQAGQEPASITDTDGTSGDLTVDFGFFAPVTVGDTVWYDGDRDGEQDGGTETGVQDVKVTLFKADGSAATDITGALVATQLTDSTGQYFFSNLPPGDYYVQFDKTTLPAGYIFTTSNASGVADDVDSDADSDGKTGNTGYLPSGDSDITLDAGIFRAVVTVGDLVWYDNNRNGLYEPLLGEDGVPNVKVTLYNAATDAPQATYAGGMAVTPATTDDAGLYLFADLPPGSYYVVFDLATLPAGYTVTTQDVGSNGFDPQDSDADPSTGKTSATPSLIDGQADLTLDMGIFNPVTVGDYVWYDNNRDGLQGSAVDEPGVAGVKVTLFKSDGTPVTQDADGQPIAPLLTDSSGRYSFQNLLPDSYYVQFDLSTLPAGYLVTTPDVNGNSSNALDSDADATGKTAATASLKNGEADLTLDMGIYRPVSMGDYVWYDNDRDGLQDAGESGVAGVKATLFNADGTAAKDVAGSPVAAQTTDANGKYLFADLPPGSYYVQFDLTTLPVGYVLTKPNAGDDAADSDADATGKTVSTPVLKDGEQDLTLDLGVFQPASIGDYVWLDKDVDGVQDANELAVPGVQIALFKADGSPAIDVNGNPVAPQTTDATGKYQFINLPPGDYYVQFTPPASYFISTQDQGTDDNIDSDVDPTTGKTVVTTLVSGENDPSWDLGLYQGAAIGNYVWHDKNGNGLQEAGESGLPDVTVTLYDSAGNPVATTQTDAHGYYGFSNLTPGDYSVQFATPAGYVPTQSNQGDDNTLDSDAIDGHTAVTTLINGEYDTTWDAGFTLPASIGRYVWDDGPKETANGIKDPNESGVSGVIVILLDENDQEVARTITDSSGSFQFTNLAPGDYKLKFVTPSGAEFTQQVPGVDGSSDANPTTGETVVTTLTPGQLDLSWNVGIVKIPTALDTEFEPSGGNAQIYLPIIQNETQTPEGRSSFKKPSVAPMPQTLDQIVVEYWYTFLRWWGYR